MLIERIGGQPFGDFLQAHIFGPVGMTRTFSLPNARRHADPQCARGYDVERRRASLNDSDPLDTLVGSGSIFSCAEDLARFVAALFGGAIVRPETLAEGLAPVALNDGSEGAYAFGWQPGEDEGDRYVNIDGWWEGFLTHSLHFLDRRLSVYVLTNRTDLEVEPLAFEVAGRFRS